MLVISRRDLLAFAALVSLYIYAVIGATVIPTKPIPVWVVSVGTTSLLYPWRFMLIAMIAAVFGRRLAWIVVAFGVIVSLATLLLITVILAAPAIGTPTVALINHHPLFNLALDGAQERIVVFGVMQAGLDCLVAYLVDQGRHVVRSTAVRLYAAPLFGYYLNIAPVMLIFNQGTPHVVYRIIPVYVEAFLYEFIMVAIALPTVLYLIRHRKRN